MTPMIRPISITCVGDLMLELFASQVAGPRAQRTYKLDHAAATVGGAALNLCWYLNELKRSSTVVAGFGASERSRVEEALMKCGADIASLVQLSGITDVLAVLPGNDLPAAYIRGRITEQDSTALADRLLDGGVIIFGGSRHEVFRKKILERVLGFNSAMFIFSPSYSIYDFECEELRNFVLASDISVVNEHEARYLVEMLSEKGIVDLMQLPKRGGIVTLGHGGADLFSGNRFDHVMSISGREEDVVGAGEAFLAGFIHRYLESFEWKQTGEVGCAVAAQVVRAKSNQVRSPIDAKRLSNDLGGFLG
jgi:sugar/nucleoside kinase (ribokinase family)